MNVTGYYTIPNIRHTVRSVVTWTRKIRKNLKQTTRSLGDEQYVYGPVVMLSGFLIKCKEI